MLAGGVYLAFDVSQQKTFYAIRLKDCGSDVNVFNETIL